MYPFSCFGEVLTVVSTELVFFQEYIFLLNSARKTEMQSLLWIWNSFGKKKKKIYALGHSVGKELFTIRKKKVYYL